MSGAELLRKKVAAMPGVTSRPMFGYDCYMVEGRFFAGFARKSPGRQATMTMMIVRLARQDHRYQQQSASHDDRDIRPFPRGARKGWIQVDVEAAGVERAYRLAEEGYEHARSLSPAGR